MAQWNKVVPLILTLSFFLLVVDAQDEIADNHLGLHGMWLPSQFSSYIPHNHFQGELPEGGNDAPNFQLADPFGGNTAVPNEENPPQEMVGYYNNDGGYEKSSVNVAKKGDFEILYRGEWEMINNESGVSAMHINLLPTNKMLVFDAKVYRLSRLRLPEGAPCIQFWDEQAKEQRQDCFAHAMEYDIETNQVRPLELTAGDPWCSSGGLAPDGTLVSTGGFFDGAKTIRYFGGDNKCDDNNCKMREYNNLLRDERWYGSQQLLPDGSFIVVGGRRAFSYEFVPTVEGEQSKQPYFFPFLYETSDFDENNLYPFVHLSTDGNLFVFSNNRSVLLNPAKNKVIRTFPVLPGGSRNYPASGMSALLPIDLSADAEGGVVKAEVLVCGGGLHNAFVLAETKKIFLPALNDCNRMVITDRNPTWKTELMPSRRTMGDSLILPNGQILFINGAMLGAASWWDAEAPNYTPVLYSPQKPRGFRFRVLRPSRIARMYHSSSAVLPSGKIWVAGSNTHNTYKENDRYPTETRVEAFSPPYLDKRYAKSRPKIEKGESAKELKYGDRFETQFKVEDYEKGVSKEDVKVTMYAPPFTTHGVSMGQRLVILKSDGMEEHEGGVYRIKLEAPPSAIIAPSGYYLLSVVHRGLPSPCVITNHVPHTSTPIHNQMRSNQFHLFIIHFQFVT